MAGKAVERWQEIKRHSVLVRLTHWINFGCMAILLMSGLAIFNGWPALYWGERTHFAQPLLAMYATENAAGREVGMTWILGRQFVTTGWFGLSAGAHGPTVRGFPYWATLPEPLDLARARRWHFLFAWIFVINGALYAAAAVASRHLWRNLVPSRAELRGIASSLKKHALLSFPKGEEARHYNVLQKLSYLMVMFGMAPLMVASGLTMSPWIDAAWPWLLDVFGGRQSARTIHFITAFGLLAFVIIHILMVLASGLFNNMRAMITGRYRIELPRGEQGEGAHDQTRSR